MTSLTPGTDINHCGTPFTEPLLEALLDALRDPATGYPRLGDANFQSATFEGDANFQSTTFQGKATLQGGVTTLQGKADFRSVTFERAARFVSATFALSARFESATFVRKAWFGSVTFQGYTGFGSATFKREAEFTRATFELFAGFESTTFQGNADFKSAAFKREAWFTSAVFQGDAGFESTTYEIVAGFKSATFQGDARFGAAAFGREAEFGFATFERVARFGPLVCAGRIRLSGAVFTSPVTLSIAARHLECRRTRWSSAAELRLRYATVDFAHAVFEYPLTIAWEDEPFGLPYGRVVAEQAFADAPDTRVRMASLRGVDAAHLVLADVELSKCIFTGTVHLDQLRLEGICPFAEVPPRRRWRPAQYTQRRTLAEEHHWRARQPQAVRGWDVAVFGAGSVGPAQLAPVYRALRKSFEDRKDEPGAADFYYGEMEMRRHDRIGTTRAERGLLHGYWLLSGYGLRGLRALGWLAFAMLITILLLMGFGLPQESPKQEATGTVPPGGGRITFEIDKADPQNPTGVQFTGERFEKALNVTLNSVVFRSSGEDLTTTGTYVEMASRVVEPVLLGLAVLAVRNRVKR
ncbi:pentapeptide repeat-containing protein [Streptomyces sp. NBC_00873]|uniref:pentapeptide repeat-containing protein n=1 Tax=unclassified Streptomyces TaxID=2593676 RepID=UPI0038640017|nr:pentapeptide repeat-containing protein [Streptomyces sp. NBC_00873]WSY96907.1 pentapeptide repeat-containing protein [Streptomyces sp. NBC_00873]WTA41320.1 pentapeptide repeat-containing protein [Streptomyces sp. NBC_00842]WTA48577.1 pentapeptide repeat-containing protein [Streptomyces sp. NBC_00842]